MNKVSLQILAFVLCIVGIFVAICNSIPQIGSYPPRALTREDFVKLSQEEMAAKGREVFGTGGERCSQCHIVGDGTPGRGPNLGGVGLRAAGRKKGVSAQDYLIESLMEPKKYVVEGFAAIMPEVYKPPLDLSHYDVLAVTAYLESLGGEVAMDGKFELKAEYAKKIQSAKSAASSHPPKGDLAAGQKLFYQKMRCVACHQTSAQGKAVGGALGPDLSGIGLIQGPDYLRESILEPAATVVAPYRDIMPKHFRENLSDQEIDDLVVFLLSLRGS